MTSGRRGRGLAAGLIGGALFFPLYLHLERGQRHLFLLVLVLAAWRLRARPVAAGALLALAAALKPTVLLTVPVLWALGQRRVAAAALGATAAIVAITALASRPRSFTPTPSRCCRGSRATAKADPRARSSTRTGSPWTTSGRR